MDKCLVDQPLFVDILVLRLEPFVLRGLLEDLPGLLEVLRMEGENNVQLQSGIPVLRTFG